MNRRHPDFLLYCVHGWASFNTTDCPYCVQEQSDRWRADTLAAMDPERDTARREWDDWYASPDMAHALHGQEVQPC